METTANDKSTCRTRLLLFTLIYEQKVVCINGGSGPKNTKWKNQISQFTNFRALKKNPLNKFLMCFEINGLKNLKLAILCFLPEPPIYTYYSNSSKNIFIVKTP